MNLTITIDTEEDNWGEYARPQFSVENIARIPRLQSLFDRYDVRPTYLISYPVATSSAAVEILGKYRSEGRCEIGTHPHPWNTPPLDEERTQTNSYISNLPASLQYRKIETLTQTIDAAFGVRPTSYRSGKWGFNEDVARALIHLAYKVDTSVFPVWDWSPTEGPDFSRCSHEPFVYRSGDAGTLLEVPATVDFLQARRSLATSAFHTLKRLPLGDKVVAGLSRAGVLNHICVSPEINSAPDMIRLSKALLARGACVINMFFHSPSLLEGCTPFVRTSGDVEGFLARIEAFLQFAKSAPLRSATMSELTPLNVGATHERLLPTRQTPLY